MMLMKDVLERSLRLHASLLGFSQAMAGLPRKTIKAQLGRELSGGACSTSVRNRYLFQLRCT